MVIGRILNLFIIHQAVMRFTTLGHMQLHSSEQFTLLRVGYSLQQFLLNDSWGPLLGTHLGDHFRARGHDL